MNGKEGDKLNRGRGGARLIAQLALGTAITCACSLVRIPLGVPITLQTLAVFVLIGVLGEKKATFCVLCYVAVGLLGVPVFAGGGGVQAVWSATGGYIVGLVLIPLVGLAVRAVTGGRAHFAVGCAAGLAVCYAVGSLWYFLFVGSFSFAVCVVPFILPDALKLAVACAVSGRVRRAVG